MIARAHTPKRTPPPAKSSLKRRDVFMNFRQSKRPTNQAVAYKAPFCMYFLLPSVILPRKRCLRFFSSQQLHTRVIAPLRSLSLLQFWLRRNRSLKPRERRGASFPSSEKKATKMPSSKGGPGYTGQIFAALSSTLLFYPRQRLKCQIRGKRKPPVSK